MDSTRAPDQSARFLLLYAVALAGGAVAYVPFLTILMPMRVADLAGTDKVAWLAYATFAGAATASLTNILFGWLSDRTGQRKPWIMAGLATSCGLLALFPQVASLPALIGWLVAWQCALNLMLAPLAAWAGDCVPDHQKGMLGGLMAISPAAGALATTFVTIPGLASPTERLWLVAGLVVLCVLPALLLGAPRRFPELVAPREPDALLAQIHNPALVRMWLARLLIQVSEAALFAFLYFWFRSVDEALDDARIAQIFGVVLVCSIPVSILAGRWSDRAGRPFLPLPVAAAIAAAGLLLMARAGSSMAAIASYALFGLAATVFLSLHSAQTLRVLPRPERRGLHLGLFNLTNTTPSLVMPWMVVVIEPLFGFAGLFVALAGCALAAAALLATIRARN
ncbi:MAG: MFS transporter [Sphingomonadaceae bacterium]|nr:MFS transporter [Sphingomonadaceae bacterium]